MYPFNVRVYGLLINEQNEILISDEEKAGQRFSKFPGGGLEYGEGLVSALKREFLEECDLVVQVLAHFYTTDFFVKSAFDDSQILAIYYLVKNVSPLRLNIKSTAFDFDDSQMKQAFRWVSLFKLKMDNFTFPIDQHVVKLIVEKYGQ
ncbi:MAG: NUDIX domain-containing protein [Sphingobacteriaceae bacterium]